MNFSAKIIIKEDSDNIKKLFESENKEFQNDRASYKVESKNDEAEISISAKDATALRAVLNSIAKNLVIYEKVKNGQEN